MQLKESRSLLIQIDHALDKKRESRVKGFTNGAILATEKFWVNLSGVGYYYPTPL